MFLSSHLFTSFVQPFVDWWVNRFDRQQPSHFDEMSPVNYHNMGKMTIEFDALPVKSDDFPWEICGFTISILGAL